MRNNLATISADAIYVLGGHKLGCDYLGKLLKGKKTGKLEFKSIYVIDENKECFAKKDFKDAVQFIHSPYADALVKLLQAGTKNSIIIPDHTAPHVLFKVFLALLADHNYQAQIMPFTQDLHLPFQKTLDSGICAVSYATWVCPLDCQEPDICPAIENDRSWNFNDFFKKLELPSTSKHLFACDQLVYGVCGIPLATILQEWQCLKNKIKTPSSPPHKFMVATFSKCHGILGVAKII